MALVVRKSVSVRTEPHVITSLEYATVQQVGLDHPVKMVRLLHNYHAVYLAICSQ